MMVSLRRPCDPPEHGARGGAARQRNEIAPPESARLMRGAFLRAARPLAAALRERRAALLAPLLAILGCASWPGALPRSQDLGAESGAREERIESAEMAPETDEIAPTPEPAPAPASAEPSGADERPLAAAPSEAMASVGAEPAPSAVSEPALEEPPALAEPVLAEPPFAEIPATVDPSSAVAFEAMRRYGGILQNDSIVAYANALGRALAQNSPKPQAPYSFVILDSAIIDAFSAPSGAVFLTKGALLNAETEAELAGLLAHEIAHLCQGHLKKQLTAMGEGGGALRGDESASSATLGMRLPPAARGGMHPAVWILMEAGFAEEAEFAADEMAAEILERTGYNPWGIKRFCQSLARAGGRGGWAATHPNPDARVRRLNSHLAEHYRAKALLPFNTDRYYEAVLSRLRPW